MGKKRLPLPSSKELDEYLTWAAKAFPAEPVDAVDDYLQEKLVTMNRMKSKLTGGKADLESLRKRAAAISRKREEAERLARAQDYERRMIYGTMDKGLYYTTMSVPMVYMLPVREPKPKRPVKSTPMNVLGGKRMIEFGDE